MCGEKALSTFSSRKNSGSPPHVRGKAKGDEFGLGQTRITPAYAGKSLRWLRWSHTWWDHPRTCGEKVLSVLTMAAALGSPPHMRGKEIAVPGLVHSVRITPAYAGKRRSRCRQSSTRRDHPRMCGEKSSHTGELSLPLGSPPHVRGKDLIPALCCVVPGITPACAGKSQGLNIFHTKRSSGPSPAAVPAGPAGSCPASRPSQFPPRMTVISPRP